VRCSSRTKVVGANLGDVGANAEDWGASVGERGVAGGTCGGGLAGGVGGRGLAGADGEPGSEVDELGEDELLAPPARSKWT
jgi:hypothetical protein